tara:strand:+ start:400 stop:612 length:213 start_codon:yes stop_codon:yes gene_type:complete
MDQRTNEENYYKRHIRNKKPSKTSSESQIGGEKKYHENLETFRKANRILTTELAYKDKLIKDLQSKLRNQ